MNEEAAAPGLHPAGVELGSEPSRKDQAIWISKTVIPEIRGLVFPLLDGKDISDAIWRMLEPRGDE